MSNEGNKGSRPANNKGAWNCGFCRATNVTTLCGCAASRKEAGRKVMEDLASRGVIEPHVTGTGRRLLSFDDAELLANKL